MSQAESPPAIEVSGLTKVYRVYHGHGRGWLKSIVLPWLPVERYADESVALDGVDLTVHRGETVGVLGRNGSGKSTLLRVLAGMTPSTRGDVTVRGRLRCIMATGIGFNARLDGRQNIVYGSLAMGIPRAAAIERMEEIIDFAELGSEIDKPVMYYSRGMRARLALAVALQETPDVLVLDEALSAGDAAFTDRCRERIDAICQSGSTVMLATHSLAVVNRVCTRAIVLDEGRIVADSAPSAAIAAYRSLLGAPAPAAPVAAPSPVVVDDSAELEDAWLCGADGIRRERFVNGERLELHVVLNVRRRIERPRVLVDVMSADAQVRVTQLGTHYLDAASREPATLRPSELEGRCELVMAWPENPLGSGSFYFRVSLFPWSQAGGGSVVCHFRASPLCRFTSVSFPDRPWRRRTLIEAPSEMELNAMVEAQVRQAVE